MLGIVSEIFSSFQGEGLHVGERHIFVRLAGCPWRCRYCDTPASLIPDGHETLSAGEVLERVTAMAQRRRHEGISVTGGEPLMQADFLVELLPALRGLGLKIHLETNGIEADRLSRVIQYADVVAMDVKLPSAVGKELWAAHAKFLETAGTKAFVKIVLNSRTQEPEFNKAVTLVAERKHAPPLVLQPVSPVESLHLSGADGHIKPPSPGQLMKWWDHALHRLPDVRLIPQLHPMWGVP